MRSLRILIAVGSLIGSQVWADESLPAIPPDLQRQDREARSYFEQGDYVKAEGAFRDLVKRAPTNVRVLSNFGVALFRTGKYEEAEVQIKKALEWAPGDAFSHRVLGIIHYVRGRHVAAAASLEQALAIAPKDAIAHNYQGINASQLGRPKTAVSELKTAISLDPGYADACFNLAVVLVIQEGPDLETGRGYYERALKLGASPDETMEKLLGMADENGLRTVENRVTPQQIARLRSVLASRQ